MIVTFRRSHLRTFFLKVDNPAFGIVWIGLIDGRTLRIQFNAVEIFQYAVLRQRIIRQLRIINGQKIIFGIFDRRPICRKFRQRIVDRILYIRCFYLISHTLYLDVVYQRLSVVRRYLYIAQTVRRLVGCVSKCLPIIRKGVSGVAFLRSLPSIAYNDIHDNVFVLDTLGSERQCHIPVKFH